jgi:hypothetical protein
MRGDAGGVGYAPAPATPLPDSALDDVELGYFDAKNAGRRLDAKPDSGVCGCCAGLCGCCCCLMCCCAAIFVQSCMRYASSVLSVNGFISAKASKPGAGTPPLPTPAPTPASMLSAGLRFSCSLALLLSAAVGLPDSAEVANALVAENSGMSVVCTGVKDIDGGLPAQNAPALRALAFSRGLVGRSLSVFGIGLVAPLRPFLSFDDALPPWDRARAAGTAGRGAGGGRMGESSARPERSAFLSASTSWRRARFSSLVLPSSERMASSSRSRSAMSPSSVVMYSVRSYPVSASIDRALVDSTSENRMVVAK